MALDSGWKEFRQDVRLKSDLCLHWTHLVNAHHALKKPYIYLRRKKRPFAQKTLETWTGNIEVSNSCGSPLGPAGNHDR